jgi:hypothetical protein
MKTIKNGHNLTLLTASFAITISTTSLTPANAQKAQTSVPEIGWSSRISSMGLDKNENIGNNYTFDCQPAEDDLIHPPIWGTNIYTLNSGICSTAVHAGLITQKQGGEITVKILEGQEFYTGSDNNNIVSQDHRSTNMSFTFVGAEIAANKSFSNESEQQQEEPSNLERIVVHTLQQGVERTIEKAITNIFK